MTDSGLFGLWGEKHAQLGSARDHAKLEQFGRLNRLHGHPDDISAKHFFDNCHTNDFEAKLRRSQAGWVKDCWDWAAGGGLAIEDREAIWPRRIAVHPITSPDWTAPPVWPPVDF
jgi:hypothetical protein